LTPAIPGYARASQGFFVARRARGRGGRGPAKLPQSATHCPRMPPVRGLCPKCRDPISTQEQKRSVCPRGGKFDPLAPRSR
jgi:hypothetical protein